MTENERHEEFVDETAGYVGMHEALVGTETSATSLNVPNLRAGAAENAAAAEAARHPDQVFVPATHHGGGDVLDTTGEEEDSALRAKAESEDPFLAAEDAARADLEGA